MGHAGLSLETGSHSQLHQDDQLGFDPNVEIEDEALDFDLDKSLAEAEGLLAETLPEDLAVSGHGEEIDDADQEVQIAAAENGHIKIAKGTEDITEEAGGEAPRFQDEISYEDDVLVTADIDADSSIAPDGDTEAGLASDPSKGHVGSAPSPDRNGAGTVVHDADMSWDQDIDVGEDAPSQDEPGDEISEDGAAQDGPGDDGEDVAAQDEPGDDIDEDVVATQDEPGDDIDENASEQAESNNDLAVDKLDVAEDASEPAESSNGLAVDRSDDETRHDQADAHDSDLDEVLEDLSNSLRKTPNMEVIYNDECYSLFGTSDDDPDTYFLSDSKQLDEPLSQFLLALRAVISDELAPTDELVIRVDPLELEFGERSNDKFLQRNFREILDCHASLSRVYDKPTAPVVYLTVRRDSEEHFLDLLAQADLVKDAPSEAEDSEMSENQDDESQVESSGDGQMQDAASDDESLGEHPGEEEAAAATDHAKDEAMPEGSHPGVPQGQDDVAREQGQATEAGSGIEKSEDAEDLEVEAHSERSGRRSVEDEVWEEQDPRGDPTGSQHVEIAGDVPAEEYLDVNEQEADEQGWDEQAADGDAAASDQEELSLEFSNEHADLDQQQEAGPSPYATSSSAVEESTHQGDGDHDRDDGAHERRKTSAQPFAQSSYSTATAEEEHWEIDYSDGEDDAMSRGSSEDGRHLLCDEQAAGANVQVPKWADANSTRSVYTSTTGKSGDTGTQSSFDIDADDDAFQDDDLILAFDEEPNADTVREDTDEYQEYNITYDVSDNLVDDEDTHQPDDAEAEDESGSKRGEMGGQAANVAETASDHTSTTINGDEIDYDEEGAANASFRPADEGTQQSVAASRVDDDEIGWENDEEENEQQSASGDGVAELDASNEASPSPPGTAGKRSRSDETESLADETDHKRRRT